jgi:hypothetical protein
MRFIRPLSFLTILLSLWLAGVSLAQDDQGNPNDPTVNERANACFAGGSLEGKCHTTDADANGVIDDLDVAFMWWCGWYIIRAEQGLLRAEDTPEGCYFEPAPVATGCPDFPVFIARTEVDIFNLLFMIADELEALGFDIEGDDFIFDEALFFRYFSIAFEGVATVIISRVDEVTGCIRWQYVLSDEFLTPRD